MNIFSKLFNKKKNDNVGGMEDFRLLIRVYYQETLATQLGINNLAVLSDLRIFKQTYHVATQNNKIGLAEKKHCQKIMQNIYQLNDNFFKEIDSSIKKRCRTVQDVQPYMHQFMGFVQDLMMVISNQMQWKLRFLGFMKKAVRTMVETKIHEIMTRNDWKDESVRRACISLHKYQASLAYSEAWMTEFAYTVVMLAQKEPRPQNTN